MTKFKADPFPTDIPASYPAKEVRELFEAILALKTIDEATDFFRDLLTMSEITEFANRWQMVKLLVKGNSYLSIAQKLNVSTTTVSRVAHWLFNGRGGYKVVAERMFPKKFKDSQAKKPFKLRGKYTFISKA